MFYPNETAQARPSQNMNIPTGNDKETALEGVACSDLVRGNLVEITIRTASAGARAVDFKIHNSLSNGLTNRLNLDASKLAGVAADLVEGYYGQFPPPACPGREIKLQIPLP